MTQGDCGQPSPLPHLEMPRMESKRNRINSNNSEGSSGSRDSPAITSLVQGEFFMDRQHQYNNNHHHQQHQHQQSPHHHEISSSNGHNNHRPRSSRSPDPTSSHSHMISRDNRGSEKSNSSSGKAGSGGGCSRKSSGSSRTQKDTLSVIPIAHASSTHSMGHPSTSPLHVRRSNRSKNSINSREGNNSNSNSSSNFNITNATEESNGHGTPSFSMGRRRSSMPNVYEITRIKLPAEGGESRDNRLRRVRSFKTTSKGAVVNRGDSFKKKSTHSLRSSGYTSTDAARQLEQQLLLQQQLQQHQQFLQQQEIVDDPYAVEAVPVPIPTYFRIIMMGAAGTGKTTLAKQFMTSDFVGSTEDNPEATQENSVTVLLDGEESTIQVIDPVNRNVIVEGLQQLLDAYVVVFAINDHASFEAAQELVRYLRVDFGTDRVILLVGNKTDLVRKRKVSAEEARLVCETYDCKFTETSAALNHHVDELLVGVLTQIRLHMRIPFTTISFPGKEHQNEDRENHRSCKGPRKFFSRLFRRTGRKKLRECENLHSL